MADDLSLAHPAAIAPRPEQLQIHSGADLVRLTEELYVDVLRLVLVFTIAGCALSIWFGGLSSLGSVTPWTMLFAGLAAAFAVVGLAHPRRVYCWLRYSRVRQALPAALAVIAVALDGPASPSWWVALPLLWVVAVVGSAPLTFAAALVTAAAYLVGTLICGQALIDHGDAGTLAATIGLPVNAMVGRFAAELFAGFVLRLHQLEREVADPGQQATVVPNLAPAPPARPSVPDNPPRRSPRQSDRPSTGLRLTARQLEAALLACDGLRQGEIAVCLGISPRQVERLLQDARQRSGAQTTSQLAAMLVIARLAPESATE